MGEGSSGGGGGRTWVAFLLVMIHISDPKDGLCQQIGLPTFSNLRPLAENELNRNEHHLDRTDAGGN